MDMYEICHVLAVCTLPSLIVCLIVGGKVMGEEFDSGVGKARGCLGTVIMVLGGLLFVAGLISTVIVFLADL